LFAGLLAALLVTLSSRLHGLAEEFRATIPFFFPLSCPSRSFRPRSPTSSHCIACYRPPPAVFSLQLFKNSLNSCSFLPRLSPPPTPVIDGFIPPGFFPFRNPFSPPPSRGLVFCTTPEYDDFWFFDPKFSWFHRPSFHFIVGCLLHPPFCVKHSPFFLSLNWLLIVPVPSFRTGSPSEDRESAYYLPAFPCQNPS